MKPWYSMSDDIGGIPISRWISSWYIAGGHPSRPKIQMWLMSLIVDGKHLSHEEVDCLVECIVNGKLELEESAKDFV